MVKVLPNLFQCRRPIHPDGIFIVMDQTAVVKVNRPYNRHFVICQDLLAMDKTRCILINLYSCIHQIQVSPTSYDLDQFFIWNMRGHDPNIYPSKGCIADILCQIIVNDQVRSCDVDIIRCLIDHILINRLSDLRLVNRLWSTPIRNVKPFSLNRLVFNMVAVKILNFPTVDVPVHEKQSGQGFNSSSI